jgi:hypothetical protein
MERRDDEAEAWDMQQHAVQEYQIMQERGSTMVRAAADMHHHSK